MGGNKRLDLFCAHEIGKTVNDLVEGSRNMVDIKSSIYLYLAQGVNDLTSMDG